jgi:hypothetical protein
MPTTWITHEGKRILYTDFRDCHSESEMEAVFEKAVQIVLTSPEPVLTMNNFDGVAVPPSFLRTLRTRGADYKHNVRAKAVLGVTGIKKTLINTYSVLTGIDARAFDTEAAALAYLTSRE